MHLSIGIKQASVRIYDHYRIIVSRLIFFKNWHYYHYIILFGQD